MKNNRKFCRKEIKKLVCIPGIIMLCLLLPQYADAGGINGNEARVIGIAQGGFEYNGEQYIARQEYVNQLISYLSKDDVNMTAEQADAAANKVYSSIEQAISDGYIVKVESDENDLDTSKEIQIDEISPEEKADGIKTIEELEKKNAENSENKGSGDKSGTDKPKGNVKQDDGGAVEVFDSDGKSIAQINGILKDTGFSLSSSLYIAAVLGIIFTAVLVTAIVRLTFAHKHAAGS